MSINAKVYQSVIERDEKNIFLLYRDLIDRQRIMLAMEHDARFVHLEIFERLKMPPRLLAHLTLVHDAEKRLLKEMEAAFPKVKIDKELALFGAATHDIGKCVCKNELTQPGHEHEAQGQKLLLSLISEKGYNFIVHRGSLYAPILESIAVPLCSGELEQRIPAVGKFLTEYALNILLSF